MIHTNVNQFLFLFYLYFLCFIDVCTISIFILQILLSKNGCDMQEIALIMLKRKLKETYKNIYYPR